MTYVIKLSKATFDVKTCADKDLIFSSELNMLKVAKVGTTSTTVAHGLAYIPAYIAMNKISATKYGIVGQTYFSIPPYTDATNFNGGGSGSDSKYYIFYQQGS